MARMIVRNKRLEVISSDQPWSGDVVWELTKDQAESVGIVVPVEEEDIRRYFECPFCRRQYYFTCHLHPHFVCEMEWGFNGTTVAEQSVPPYLELRESRIRGAGRGIFTKIDLPIGYVFGPYIGDEKSVDPESSYSWLLESTTEQPDWWVDAADENGSNFLRFVNGARSDNAENVTAIQFADHIFYYVCKPIATGKELLCYYGDEFGAF